MADEDESAKLHLESSSPSSSSQSASACWNGPSKRSSSCKAAAAAVTAEAVVTQQQTTPTDSNSNPISPIVSDEEEEEEEGLEHCQSESYHWCEEDSDLTSSEAVTTTTSQTDKTQTTSSGDQQQQQLEYVEMAKKVDTNLAHIDIEDFKSADLFRSESLLIEYQERCSQSQDDCSLTDCGSICKSGPLFSPQRNVIQKSQKGSHLPDFSTDSLMLERCEEDEDDECWLLQEQTDCGGGQTNSSTGPNNLCRTNVTNYTLAWSSTSVGTDQDLDYNEPGTSSSGSEQSHWSSSGSGGGRIAPPPIPPWPELRAGPTLQCWLNQPSLPSTPKKTAVPIKNLTSQSTKTKPPSEDNPTLSDQDNGNGCKSSNRSSSRQRPVFTSKMEPTSTTGKGSSTSPGTAATTTGLSLLQIYMRQRSQTSIERETTHQRSGNMKDEEIASGGGEGWVEEYPSSADEKLGLESISSSLADAEDDDGDDDDTSNSDEDDHCDNIRSLTLTDVSDDIEQTSMQIDAVPFNSAGQQQASSPSSSLDKLIAKIKPFELGLSPASIEEHWNFESRLHGRGATTGVEGQDKGCQVVMSPPVKHEETGTCTEPQKQQAYLIFPSYSLPDLSFLKKHDYTWIGEALLSPQDLPAAPITPIVQQKHFDDLKRRQLGHVKDWESLKVLLPEEIRQKISFASRPQRPKSCDHSVKLRESKKSSSINRPLGYRAASACYPESSGNYALPTVLQSPTSEGPPPLPKRTASLPHSPATTPRQLHRRNAEKAHNQQHPSPPLSSTKPKFGYTIRKTVSFGEHLGSGGVIRTPHSNQYKRPLSLSHWSGAGSLDIDSPYEPSSNTSSFNLEQKQELVQGVSVASAQLCKIAHQSLMMYSRQDTDADDITQSKLISRCLTGQLSPAIYQLLSDGLLPNVNTFFGQVNNSVWRVVEASVKKGPMLPWIEELVFCLNSEESLPEGPVRFGVFITELVNMGGLDWWLDNLSAKETILRRHYAPNGFLYLCHTSTRPLMEEIMASLRPLASLPFDSPGKPTATTSTAVSQAVKMAPTLATTPSTTANKTILKSPNRTPVKQHSQPLQRPVSYVQNSPSHKPQYRRTQSQHSGLSSPSKRSPQQQQQPDNSKTESKVEEFSSLKQKWESLSKTTAVKTTSDANVPVKSRIPRPVFRFNK